MTATWVPADTFGLRLRLVRIELGLSVDEIAHQCGFPTATWSKWERGANPRRLDTIVRSIAENTGVDRDWLIWGGPLGTGKGAESG